MGSGGIDIIPSNHKPRSIIVTSTSMIAPLFSLCTFHTIQTKLVAAGDSTARAANNSRQVSIAQNVINRLMATIMGLRICMKLQSIIQIKLCFFTYKVISYCELRLALFFLCETRKKNIKSKIIIILCNILNMYKEDALFSEIIRFHLETEMQYINLICLPIWN